jgi:glycosyltransferase involved in cell wall biosynthesis
VTPRVSVLLPVRDAAETLPECLASLGAQSLRDHEVIAVEDGSRDASGAILERAARDDPRVRVFRTPARGLVRALNQALGLARAPLLARMDADDIAHPDRLAVQAGRLESDASVDVLGSRVRWQGESPEGGMRAYVDWQNSLLDHEAITRDLFVESPLVHPSVMMRAQALRALAGYRDFGGPEDYDLWLRAHAAGLRFAKTEQTLLTWRDREDRLTRRDPRYAPERFRELKLETLGRGLLAPGREAVIWGAGKIGKAWARALLARGCALRAFAEVDPRKLGQRIHGAPVLDTSGAAALRGPLHLAAVGQPGARERIRAEARRLGLVEGTDLVAVA